ncbi:MAG: response regulator [Verrucomicrobiota bacterium]
MQPSDPARILIVDDEPTLRLGFEYSLQTEGFAIETAGGGDEALDRLGECDSVPIDVVLLDLRMPGKDGLEVLRDLRAAGNYIPVALASAFVDMHSLEEALSLGVVDFVQKPTTPDCLRRVVWKIVAEERNSSAVRASDPMSLARHHLRRGQRRAALDALKEAQNPFSTSDQSALCALIHLLEPDCSTNDGEPCCDEVNLSASEVVELIAGEVVARV